MNTTQKTRFTLLVGLDVSDPALYAEYRAAMAPIMARYGGAFGYDFVVGEVLKSEVPETINRVFTLSFPDRAAREGFFADPEYQAVRARYFEPSVASATYMATFEAD